MSGIVIFLTVPGNNLLHLVNSRNVVSKGEKLTPLLGVISLEFYTNYYPDYILQTDKNNFQFRLSPVLLVSLYLS